MITEKSLSEQLLPNLYVKNVTLDTGYNTTQQSSKKSAYSDQFAPGANGSSEKAIVPSDSINSKLVLSTKFIQNDNLQSELAQFFDSELTQGYRVYIHQITDIKTYNSINEQSSNPGYFAQDLGAAFNGIGVQTAEIEFIESYKNSKASFGDISAESGVIQQLPTQVLDDGTVLNEIITEIPFNNIPKRTTFLAYVMVSTIQSLAAPEYGIDPIGPFVSAVKREIVILKGQLQNRGFLFTIDAFPAGSDVGQLSEYGKPGDIWAGPVHYHQPLQRFMAGSTHDPDLQQPYLNYSIVPITKFVDNRVKDKIEKNIVNLTQAFEKLSPNAVQYKNNNLNVLDFDKTKQKSFISDVYLSQDAEGNTHGAFVVNKYDAIKSNSSFKFLFDNAEQALSDAGQIETFKSKIISLSSLNQCYIYNHSELLGTISEGKNLVEIKPDEAEHDSNKYKTVSFKLEKNQFYVPNANNTEQENFLFKHEISDGFGVNLQYSVKLEYTDPTIKFVQSVYKQLTKFKPNIDTIINILEKGTGKNSLFDYVTERIKPVAITRLKNANLLIEQNSAMYPTGIFDISLDDLFICFYANKELSLSEFKQYVLNLTNLKTTTITNLLIFNKFFNNLMSKLEDILTIFASKPIKTSKGDESQYVDALNKGNVESTFGKKVIEIQTSLDNSLQTKIKTNSIMVKDSGYDFTAGIDIIPELSGRQKNGFLNITTQDYAKFSLLHLKNLASSELFESAVLSNIPVEVLGQENKKYIFTLTEGLYSYININPLNIPELKASVLLPHTVLDMSAGNINSSTVLTAIMKNKLDILEDNTKGFTGENNVAVCLKEDLISLLLNDGMSVPSVSQSQIEFEELLNIVPAKSSLGGFQNISDVVTESESLLSPLTPKDNFSDLKGNKFKASPTYTKQLTAKTNLDVSNNNLLNSIFARKYFTNTKNNFSFKFKKVKLFTITISGNIIPLPQGTVPLQILCLLPSKSAGVLKNFNNDDQGYFKNGVVNPSRISDFWFGHQNIARVEYLSGYQTTTDTVFDFKENSAGVIPPDGTADGAIGQTQVSHINLKKPQWSRLTASVFNDIEYGKKILCRIVKHKYGVNRTLASSFDMPLINSYFTLSRNIQTL